MTHLIGLMCDYWTRSKFTTKPRLRDIFSNPRCLRVVFTWRSFHLWCFGNKFMIKFKIYILKPRLDGDFSLSDVITHEDY